jgi:hypothetical protein
VVVGREQVLALEEGVDPVPRGQLDDLLGGLAGGKVELHPGGRAAVDVEAQRLGGVGPAGVADGEPGDLAAASGLDGEAGQGPVGRPFAHRLVAGAGRDQPALGVGQPTVGQQHETDGHPWGLQALGQGEGGGEVGGAGRGGQRVEGVGESVAVGVGRQDHPGPGAGLDQAGHAAGREIAP